MVQFKTDTKDQETSENTPSPMMDPEDCSGIGDDSTNDDNVHDDSKAEEREVIAKQEGRVVLIFRVLLMLVLIMSAIGVSFGVYRYSTSQETALFEKQFDADAAKVLESVGITFENTLGSTDAFIAQLVAYARYSDSEWPFVTMPKFAIHASKLLKLSKAFHFAVYPFVQPSQKEEWENYANETSDWIYESLTIQNADPGWHGDRNVTTFQQSSYEIFVGGQETHDEPFPFMNNYLPTWQVHPMVPAAGWGNTYNYDYWQVSSAQDIVRADKEKRVTVSPVIDPNLHGEWAQHYARPGIGVMEPYSVITFPVYDALDTVTLDLTQEYPFVGALTFSLYWREMLTNILAPGSAIKIVVVFEDSCTDPFTYQLDGPNAIYLGVGDLHDTQYDHLRQTATLADLVNSRTQTSSYTGLPISDSECPRVIHVYPSADDLYSSNDPIVFTIVAASIFLFTSILFLAYDFWVARRQRLVMQRALASGAIVSSLFPKNVRQQLYEQQEQDKKQKEEQNPYLAKNYANKEGDMFSNSIMTAPTKGSRPIADYFGTTSIFFADLVGFTSWSNKRTPVDVFDLLESVYGRFDKIAARRKVFKVETIGDCYVAVTGIPNPQKNHAAILARFASECRTALVEVTRELSDRLGKDTMDLRMRVGLHSGAVTAGVLRGEKGRFQLFGDAVNTAARMESTGVPDKIHCSEQFAAALKANDKGQWLVPREDKVQAKGLGELCTFWVVPSDVARTAFTSTNEGYSVDSSEVLQGEADAQESEEVSNNKGTMQDISI